MIEPRNSPETRAKIAVAVKARYEDPEYRAKIAAAREKATEAARVANAGRKLRIAELEAANQALERELDLALAQKWKYSTEASQLRDEVHRLTVLLRERAK